MAVVNLFFVHRFIYSKFKKPVKRFRPSRLSPDNYPVIISFGAKPPSMGAKAKYDFYFAGLTRALLGNEDQALRLIQYEQNRGNRAGLEITKVQASKVAFEQLQEDRVRSTASIRCNRNNSGIHHGIFRSPDNHFLTDFSDRFNRLAISLLDMPTA
ncbi:MAG: hypothetical protein HHJ09_15515 [Glaciimonas sp.]|nr:hypothetical protein [Glaciimonas sp.]